MVVRIGIVAAMALLLAACSSFDCGSAGDGHRAAGACGAHTTFFESRQALFTAAAVRHS